jgi:hypothetical protein
MKVLGCVVADGGAEVLQIASCPANIAAHVDVLLAGRSRYVGQHAASPEGVQPQHTGSKFGLLRLIVPAILKVNRQHVGDINFFDVSGFASGAVFVRDVFS